MPRLRLHLYLYSVLLLQPRADAFSYRRHYGSRTKYPHTSAKPSPALSKRRTSAASWSGTMAGRATRRSGGLSRRMYVYVCMYIKYATLAGLVGGRPAVNCDITLYVSLALNHVRSLLSIHHYTIPRRQPFCTNAYTMSAPAVDLKKPVQEPQTEKEVQKGLSDDACVIFLLSSFHKRIADSGMTGWLRRRRV